jgi:hypothetical protein
MNCFQTLLSNSTSAATPWAPFLLPPAVLAGNGGAVQALADLSGEPDKGSLLRGHLAVIFAQLFPLSRSTAAARRPESTAAVAALRGPLLAQAAGHLTGPSGGSGGVVGGGSLDAQYFRKLTAIVAEMTQLVQPPEPPPALDGVDPVRQCPPRRQHSFLKLIS